MATWQGEAWLGSTNGRQTVSVQSNTYHGAREQIERIYNADDVWNLREVRSSRLTSGGGINVLPLLLFLVIFGAIIEYWFVIIPVTIIPAIIWMMFKYWAP